jgi:hypothetical protein
MHANACDVAPFHPVPSHETSLAARPRQYFLNGFQLLQNSEILSGAVGGPLVVGFLTPQRNAMTLGAKDATSSFFQIYRQVFRNGVLQAFRGGSRPTFAAVPQFTMIGPAYLLVHQQTQSPSLALFASSMGESLLTYNAQRRNAQIQFNASRPPSQHIAFESMSKLWGPGFVCHVLRNAVAMTGIRIVSPYAMKVVEQLPGIDQSADETKFLLSDLGSSSVSAVLSMPFNHVFSWASCTPELKTLSRVERLKAYATFLITNYKAQGCRLLARDLLTRICYTAPLFTGYHFVERQMKNHAA